MKSMSHKWLLSSLLTCKHMFVHVWMSLLVCPQQIYQTHSLSVHCVCARACVYCVLLPCWDYLLWLIWPSVYQSQTTTQAAQVFVFSWSVISENYSWYCQSISNQSSNVLVLILKDIVKGKILIAGSQLYYCILHLLNSKKANMTFKAVICNNLKDQCVTFQSDLMAWNWRKNIYMYIFS